MAEPSEAAKKRACELANAIDDTAMTQRDRNQYPVTAVESGAADQGETP